MEFHSKSFKQSEMNDGTVDAWLTTFIPLWGQVNVVGYTTAQKDSGNILVFITVQCVFPTKPQI